MAYKGIIWDMDGLMFNSEQLYLEANVAAGRTMGILVTPEQYHELVGASEEESEDFNRSHFKSDRQLRQFIDLTEQFVLQMVAAGRLMKKPGLDALLAYLAAQKRPSVIASSNNDVMLSAFLGTFDLKDAFSAIITREQVSASKPAPDLFLKAQAVMGLPKKALLILEDSKNGIMAADAAGIDAVMVPDLVQPDTSIQAKATAILPDLNAVLQFLKAQDAK